MNLLLSKRSPSMVQAVSTRVRELALRYYERFALVVVSWNSLSGPQPNIVIRPVAAYKPDITYRFARSGDRLDVYVQIHARKEELDTFTTGLRTLTHTSDPSTYIASVARLWLSTPALSELEMVPETLRGVEVLSALLQGLCRRYPINEAIAITLMMYDTRPCDDLRAEMRDQLSETRASDALIQLAVTTDRERFLSYVDTHRSVCVYDDWVPLRVMDIPTGVGFADLVPRRYIIEPFVAIATDTLDRPLVPLSRDEESRLHALPDASPDRGTVRKYYVVRRSSRTECSSDMLHEYLSPRCYATRLLVFDTFTDAFHAMNLLARSRGRYVKPPPAP
jgi:hypothetical protein